jgi:L-fuculose-phosphate aldolase
MSSVLDESSLQFRIAAGRRMLFREGCDSNVSGHVSARADDGDGFWVTGFEYFDETVPNGIAKLDFDLNVIIGEHALSPAVNFHALIYRLRPDVNAIVHLHSHYISVLSSLGVTVGMYNVAAVLFDDEQVTYFDDGHKAHTQVAHDLGDKRVALLKNHGAIVASDTIEHAIIEAMTLERCAQYHLECVAAGGTEIERDEVIGGKAMYRKYFLQQMWQANYRRLRRSDPDLFETLD